MKNNKQKSLKEYPYSERQLIFVDNDKVANITNKALSKKDPLKWIKSWVKENPASAAKIFAVGLLFGPISLLKLGSGFAGIKLIKKLSNFKKETGLNLKPISKQQAKDLKFPPGHYRKGMIYVGHPLEWNKYYPISNFHKFIFEHKFNEIITLLMNLGAKEISVEREQGYGFDSSAGAGFDFVDNIGSLGGEVKFDKKRTRKGMYKAKFNSTNKKKIPSDLVWYSNELSWQQIAKGRMDHGLNDFSLKLEYTEDFGVNSKLKGKIKGVGFDIDGSFTNYKKTIWKISGKFS